MCPPVLPLTRRTQENRARIKNYRLHTESSTFFFDPEIARAAQNLWNDEIMPALMDHSSDFYLMDSAP